MKVALFVSNSDTEGPKWAFQQFGRSNCKVVNPKYFETARDVLPYLVYRINEQPFKVNEVYMRDPSDIVKRAAASMKIPVHDLAPEPVPDDAVPLGDVDLPDLDDDLSEAIPVAQGSGALPLDVPEPGSSEALYANLMTDDALVGHAPPRDQDAVFDDNAAYFVQRRGAWFAVVDQAGTEMQRGFRSSEEADQYIAKLQEESAL